MPEPTSDELRLATARAAVGPWLAAATADGEFEVTDVALDGDTVVVDVVGPTSPPGIRPSPRTSSSTRCRDQLNVRWSQRLGWRTSQPTGPGCHRFGDGRRLDRRASGSRRPAGPADSTGAMVEVDLLGEVPRPRQRSTTRSPDRRRRWGEPRRSALVRGPLQPPGHHDHDHRDRHESDDAEPDRSDRSDQHGDGGPGGRRDHHHRHHHHGALSRPDRWSPVRSNA
ncbi:MAG: hypothetical protein R2705_03105 [Ilumatobacteraceae bacterium]